jgi:hypothetical protein
VKEMLKAAVEALEPIIDTQRKLLSKLPSPPTLPPSTPPIPLTPELTELGRHVYRGEKGESKAFRGKREAEYRSLVVEKLGLSEEEAADEDNETLYKALKVRYLCMFRMALDSSLSLIARRLSHTISPILPAARFARRPTRSPPLALP